MQAIARVNRVFRDKPAGLVVDYLGIAEQLRQAIGTYGGKKGTPPGVPVDEALKVLVENMILSKGCFMDSIIAIILLQILQRDFRH